MRITGCENFGSEDPDERPAMRAPATTELWIEDATRESHVLDLAPRSSGISRAVLEPGFSG